MLNDNYKRMFFLKFGMNLLMIPTLFNVILTINCVPYLLYRRNVRRAHTMYLWLLLNLKKKLLGNNDQQYSQKQQ